LGEGEGWTWNLILAFSVSVTPCDYLVNCAGGGRERPRRRRLYER